MRLLASLLVMRSITARIISSHISLSRPVKSVCCLRTFVVLLAKHVNLVSVVNYALLSCSLVCGSFFTCASCVLLYVVVVVVWTLPAVDQSGPSDLCTYLLRCFF